VRLIREEEHPASCAGSYSVYAAAQTESNVQRLEITKVAVEANAVELEPAATAAFFATGGYADPRAETACRKPDTAAAGRLDKAKTLCAQFAQLRTLHPIRSIVLDDIDGGTAGCPEAPGHWRT
jgi:uncharacterized protein